MRKTWRMGSALRWVAASVTLMAPAGVAAQSAQCGTGEILVPDLGISGLDCVGECQVTLGDDGRERQWQFSVEPRIIGIREGSPAAGRLQVGDRIVSLDDALITTRGAGLRFAQLAAGERVSVKVRRNGQVEAVSLQVGSVCRNAREALGLGRVPPPPPKPDAAKPVVPVVAPRALRGVATPREPVAPLAPPPAPDWVAVSPGGRLGAGFQCSNCGTRLNEATGKSVWFFSSPLEITSVEPGGPADEAGIQVGDLVAAVDGIRLDTPEGGARLTALEPGEPVAISVVRRDGREVQVRVVPAEARPTRAVAPAGAVGVATPAPATRPARPAEAVAPAERPVSFVGSVAGVEVEVRGGPVQVSEYQGERVMVIDAGGVVVRIRVPPAPPKPEGR